MRATPGPPRRIRRRDVFEAGDETGDARLARQTQEITATEGVVETSAFKSEMERWRKGGATASVGHDTISGWAFTCRGKPSNAIHSVIEEF